MVQVLGNVGVDLGSNGAKREQTDSVSEGNAPQAALERFEMVDQMRWGGSGLQGSGMVGRARDGFTCS